MNADMDVSKVREEPRIIHLGADGCIVEIFDSGAMQITRNGYVIRQHIWKWHQAARLGCEPAPQPLNQDNCHE